METTITAISSIEDHDSPHLLTLHRDLMLLRPAILYADRVHLISPNAILLPGAIGSRYASPRVRLQMALTQAKDGVGWPFKRLTHQQALSQWNEILRIERTSLDQWAPIDQRIWQFYRRNIEELYEEIGPYFETVVLANYRDIIRRSGFDELQLAIDQGIVTVKELPSDDPDHWARAFSVAVGQSFADPIDFPLIDSKLEGLVRAELDRGVWRSEALLQHRAAHAAAGVGFIQGLPSFPKAHMEELLRLREDIASSRRAYQVKVAELSRQIDDEPFSLDMRAHVAEVFRDEVLPAVDDLRRNVESAAIHRRIGRAIGHQLPEAAKAVGSAVATLGLSYGAFGKLNDAVSALPPEYELGARLAAGGVASTTVAIRSAPALWNTAVNATTEVISGGQQAKAVKRNGLFYLLQLDDRLRGPAPRN